MVTNRNIYKVFISENYMEKISRLLRKIGIVLMPLSAISVLNACTPVYSFQNRGIKKENIEEVAKKESIIEKRLRPKNQIFVYSNGCTSSETTRRNLILTAGIYAGTIKVEKTKNGYSIRSGFYDQESNPEAIEWVSKKADKNNDCKVTWEEADSLQKKILNEKSKK